MGGGGGQLERKVKECEHIKEKVKVLGRGILKREVKEWGGVAY